VNTDACGHSLNLPVLTILKGVTMMFNSDTLFILRKIIKYFVKKFLCFNTVQSKMVTICAICFNISFTCRVFL